MKYELWEKSGQIRILIKKLLMQIKVNRICLGGGKQRFVQHQDNLY